MTLKKKLRSTGFALLGTLGLSLALLTPTAPASAAPTKSFPKTPVPSDPAFQWFDGTIRGIDTDAQGTILHITIQQSNNDLISKPGCGAKIANLPHIANGLGMRLKMRVVNNCIDRYTLMKF